MGIDLINEVLDHAPTTLTTGQRLLLVVLAEDFRTETRMGWPGMDKLTRRTRMTDRGVRQAMEGLVAAGVVQRVTLGYDKTGRPIYAHAGQSAMYRIAELVHSPAAEPELSTEGGTTVPPPRRRKRRNPRAGKAEPDGRKGGTTVPPSPHTPSRSRHLSARELEPVIRAVEETTGKRIDAEDARLIVKRIVVEHPEVRKPVAYAVVVIRNDQDPRRLLPPPQPPRYDGRNP